MFIEIETVKGEKVFLNVKHILFVTQYKNGAVVFDELGNDYRVDEPYSCMCKRITELLKNR